MQSSGRFRGVWVVLVLVAALVAGLLIFRTSSDEDSSQAPAATPDPHARRPFPKAVTSVFEDRPHRAARAPNQLTVPDPRLDDGQRK
jgi:hypothetical protein